MMSLNAAKVTEFGKYPVLLVSGIPGNLHLTSMPGLYPTASVNLFVGDRRQSGLSLSLLHIRKKGDLG